MAISFTIFSPIGNIGGRKISSQFVKYYKEYISIIIRTLSSSRLSQLIQRIAFLSDGQNGSAEADFAIREMLRELLLNGDERK